MERPVRVALRATAVALLTACGTSAPPDTLEVCLPQPAQSVNPDFKPAYSTAGVDMLIQSIMPPGQSGHFPSAASCPESGGSCAAPGQSPETYGPHIDDQRLMYWRSEYKPGRFFDTTGKTPALTFNLTEPVTDTVKVYRDDFGVPVVHAATAYGVWYGAGYALAQDRLFLVDQAIRLARGTSAETNGTGTDGKTLAADVQTRVLTYTEAEYQATFDALSARAKTTLTAHVAGINAWIDAVNADASGALKPQEMVALNYTPAHVTVTDVLALGVLMTRRVASLGGFEMVNVLALRELEAQHGRALGRLIFKDLAWQDDRKADVTIVDKDFTNVSTPPQLRDAAFERMADYAATLPAGLATGDGTGGFTVAAASRSLKLPPGFKWPVPPTQLARAVERWRELPQHVSASYMMVAGPNATADGSALLVNGPQVGYSYPTLLAEVEVHGGPYDARGVTVAGLPVVGIGYGERTVWGLTTGESKTIDSFVVELDPANAERYRYQGEFRDMECRDETVNYRSTADGVPNVSEPEPGANNAAVRVCRTLYGPVVARAGGFARSVQYAMWKREIDTVEAILDWNSVDTAVEFDRAMAKATWNENTMYADADGNIAFYHPGLHPWRHPSADQRLPLKGDGSQDHCGMLSFSRTPKSINPARGYLHNWNTKPALGWGDSIGGDANHEPSGQAGRNQNWAQVIRAQIDGDGLTYEDLVEMDKRAGRIDPRAAALLAPILACDGGCGLSEAEQALVTILKSWDRQHYNEALDITLEPTANSDPNAPEDQPYAPPAQQPDGVRDTAGATVFHEIVQAMVDDIVTDVVPPAFVAHHAHRGRHPYDAGTFHNLLAKLLDPAKSTIAPHYDWLRGRSKAQFVKETVGVALGRMQADYGTTDPAQFRRIHYRDDVCGLADPLVGPCLTMPHQDRGSWLKLVGFVPK